MKHKTSELTSTQLDVLVARAEGLSPWGQSGFAWITREDTGLAEIFAPTERWEHAGPIIERERIVLLPWFVNMNDGSTRQSWSAYVAGTADHWYVDTDEGDDDKAESPLIAAMRAYVASKFGEEVEL